MGSVIFLWQNLKFFCPPFILIFYKEVPEGDAQGRDYADYIGTHQKFQINPGYGNPGY